MMHKHRAPSLNIILTIFVARRLQTCVRVLWQDHWAPLGSRPDQHQPQPEADNARSSQKNFRQNCKSYLSGKNDIKGIFTQVTPRVLRSTPRVLRVTIKRHHVFSASRHNTKSSAHNLRNVCKLLTTGENWQPCKRCRWRFKYSKVIKSFDFNCGDKKAVELVKMFFSLSRLTYCSSFVWTYVWI